MYKQHLWILYTTLWLWSEVTADFQCVCSYAVEQKVLAQPDPDGEPIGYLYEFDCKHLLDDTNVPKLNFASYSAIEFEHRLGYVEKNQQLSQQLCPGSPSDADIIPKSTTDGSTSSSSTYPITSPVPSQGVTHTIPIISTLLSSSTTTTTASASTAVPDLSNTNTTTQLISTESIISSFTPTPTKYVPLTSTYKPPMASKTTVTEFTSTTLSSTIYSSTTATPTQSAKTDQTSATSKTTTSSNPTTTLTKVTPSTQLTTTTDKDTITTRSTTHTPSTSTVPTISKYISTADSSTTDSSTTDSSTTDISTTDSSTTDSSTTDSSTTDISTTDSSTTDSSTTDSSTTDSSTTDSSATDSSTTDSSTTDISTTDSSTTDSSTTDMQTTIPTTTTTTVPLTTTPVNTSNSELAYLGVGYNLLYGNPDAIVVGNNHTDPGFLMHQQIFQLSHAAGTPADKVREIEYTYSSQCTSSSYLVHGGGDYQKELLQYLNLQDSHTLDHLRQSAFVFNKDFIQRTRDLEASRDTVYKDNVTSCNYVTLRYKTEAANTSGFLVTKEFAKDVCKLSRYFNVDEYLPFINKWGTHVVMTTTMGIKIISRYSIDSQAILQQLSKKTPTLIYPTGAYKGYQTSVSFNNTALSHIASSLSGLVVSSDKAGTTTSPVPVSVTLAPLSTALNVTFWNPVLTQQSYMDVCPDNTDHGFLQAVANNIDIALKQYAAYKIAVSPQQNTISKETAISVPMTWPEGTYTLMEAAIGCPGGHVAWELGWRKYDTEHTSPHNTFSSNIQHYLSGSFARNNLVTNFCTKTKSVVDSAHRSDWPQGAYCILKHGNCPAGFRSGYIYWDDNDVINRNRYGGIMPDGHYDKNTKIFYCCRDDGPTSREIFLPRDRPFVLVRYRDTCQSVFGMHMREIFVAWDDEDVSNKDSAGGFHPLEDGGRHNNKLHYCHYTSKTSAVLPSIIG